MCWDLEAIVSFFRTWSGYNTFMAKNPASDILERLEGDLKQVLGEKSGEKFQFQTRYFLVLMRKMRGNALLWWWRSGELRVYSE